jgi:ABC-type transport system involved in multi-copper enzyme maturation permease subunit
MTMHSRLLFAALCGGLVAGTLDIGAAALLNSVSPLVTLVFIASGILGKAAYHAGPAAVVLGLALQWAMSLAIALIYGLGRARLGALQRSWVLGGALYGVAIFLVMSFAVVPLSRAVPQPAFALAALVGNLVVMVLFGLIVAFFAERFGEARRRSLPLTSAG